MKFIVYDIETICNCITLCFKDYETKQKKEFVLFDDINEFIRLAKFLRSCINHNYLFVGFNNINFDAQIIEEILSLASTNTLTVTVEEIAKILYSKAQLIVTLPDEEKFKQLIPESKLSIPQIDLYRQHHYDRPQKATSLKWLQFTLRYHTVQEMPIPHDVPVTKDMIPTILSYNWNDVDFTEYFFSKVMFETDLRKTLSDTYNLNLLNASEPKMVREIFGKLLSEEMGISYNDLKKLKTFRTNIAIDKIIFDYINFESPLCTSILSWFKSLNVNPNIDGTKIEKKFRFAQCEMICGLGGIHGCIKPGQYKVPKGFVMKDIDVISFYPNLAIENDCKPFHLGQSFNKIYKNIFHKRQLIPKKDPMNYIFKIILNSCYGLSKEKNGFIYDPLFTYSITVNGQLTILMLAERLQCHIPEIIFYQMNTDGLTISYPEGYESKVKDICQWFTSITKLNIEEVFYKEMIIRDVNNYIGIYTDDKKEPKKKGAFETNFNWEGKQAIFYHKNPSFNIIRLALEAYFLKGTDVETFIKNHEDIFDFLGGVKKKSDFDLNFYYLKQEKVDLPTDKYEFEQYLLKEGWEKVYDNWFHTSWHDKGYDPYKASIPTDILRKRLSTVTSVLDTIKAEKVTRFFVAKKGMTLFKDFHDGRRIGVMADWLLLPAQIVDSSNSEEIRKNLNYNYYISETKERINDIVGDLRQLSLF